MLIEFLRMYRRSAITGAVFILLLSAAGFFVWKSKRGEQPPTAAMLPIPSPTPSIGESTPSPSSSPALAFPPYRGAAVEALNADPGFLKQVPGDYYQKSLGELKDLGRELATDPRQPSLWMRVAHIKHFYNDDVGAADAYEYMTLISDDPVGYYNLALIYGYNLKQPQKAIPKFKAALKFNPWNASFYVGFANFYREALIDLPAAEKVLLEGEVKVPAEAGLYAALGSLYKAMANTAKAIAYYEKALTVRDISPGEREALVAEVKRLKAQQTSN